jgi:hypothetical protein
MPTGNDFTWSGIKQNLSDNINLGLDLKGGSHLVMRVKTDEYLKTLTENNAQAALTAAKEARDADGNPLPATDVSSVAENGNYSVKLNLSDASKAETVIEEVKKKVDFGQWDQPSTSGNSITWNLGARAHQRVRRQRADAATPRREIFGTNPSANAGRGRSGTHQKAHRRRIEPRADEGRGRVFSDLQHRRRSESVARRRGSGEPPHFPVRRRRPFDDDIEHS